MLSTDINNPMSAFMESRKKGEKVGIYSACTANIYVIEAVLERAKELGVCALIEATANQVNQFGGYTGMLPKDFVLFVNDIAKRIDFPLEMLILGGDHLGPLTWQNETEAMAMEKSEELIKQYVLAGFTKIHLDTSMRLADDDKSVRLSDVTIARRAVRLAKVSESAFQTLQKQNKTAFAPVYVIGSEVPIPGGAEENDEEISVTTPEQFEQTYQTFKEMFQAQGLEAAFARVIAVVVQPGVEFSDVTVSDYDQAKAKKLCAALANHPNLVFEGHSTDYQTKTALKQMVEGGIAILKVGPALTYALRQALFALEDMEKEVLNAKETPLSNFRKTLDEAMLANQSNWVKHYHGSESEIALKRKYSFSDRCRYYLPEKEVTASIDLLVNNINHAQIPIAVLEQYMSIQYTHLREGKLELKAENLIKDRVKDYINDYMFA